MQPNRTLTRGRSHAAFMQELEKQIWMSECFRVGQRTPNSEAFSRIFMVVEGGGHMHLHAGYSSLAMNHVSLYQF